MKIIAIGFTGGYSCYVNVTREEAIARHEAEELEPGETVESERLTVQEVEVRDGKFYAYAIGESEHP
jgi:hypothetical protein